MSELVEKLGLDWKLLLAQAVNFLAILVVLRIAAYKPIMRLLEARRKKIEQGLTDAKSAAEKLSSADHVYAEKLREAEKDGIKVFSKLEAEAKAKEAALMASAREKEAEMLASAAKAWKAKEAEADAAVRARAAELVRSAIEKTVALDPKHVDDALIAQALETVKKSNL